MPSGQVAQSIFLGDQAIETADNPLWPDAQPYDSFFFATVAVGVVWLNRESMLRGTGAVTEVVPFPDRPWTVPERDATHGLETELIQVRGG